MNKQRPITPIQFEALAKLGSMQQGPAREAARLVLVEDKTTTEAAKQSGFVGKAGYRAAYQAVKRAREKLELAHIAAGTGRQVQQKQPQISHGKSPEKAIWTTFHSLRATADARKKKG